MKKITFFLLIILSFTNLAYSQEKANENGFLFKKKRAVLENKVIRCATTEYEEYLKLKDPKRPSNSEFEKWLQPFINREINQKKAGSSIQKTAVVITIPVVVHVIHNGDNLGTDENIFDEQVASQIRVLNEDFRKKSGTPGFNSNPVGADIEIEFALAKKDPQGILTTGIDRVNLGEANWSTGDIDEIVKPRTIWNPDKYFNIWVVNFDRTDLLGYAQFPSNSSLPGLSQNSSVANTDGVVIGYKFFGSRAYFANGTYGTPYDRGRTASHEVGHWLGLRHIWGDGGCDVDDFCADTPNAGQQNEGCPANVDSCPESPGLDMIENYMDYTNDGCMNIFTQDQKSRMISIINNSPRRASLKTSDVLTPGIVFANDGAVRIFNLNLNSCSPSFAPTVEITNKGNTAITSSNIRFAIDNANFQTVNFTGNIAPNATKLITLNTLSTSSGNHSFSVSLQTVNNTTDQKTSDNTATTNFTVSRGYAGAIVNFKLQNDDYGSETTWKLKNSAGTILYQGGPYEDNIGTTQNPNPGLPDPIILTFELANNSCYIFTMEDSEGDGLCCDYGNGFYNLKATNGELIVSGGTSFSKQITTFSIGTLGINDVTELESIMVYPNPTTDVIYIKATNVEEIPETYTIINTAGQVIETKEIGLESDLQIRVSHLSQGLYFLKLSKNGEQSKTIQFIKK